MLIIVVINKFILALTEHVTSSLRVTDVKNYLKLFDRWEYNPANC